MSKQFASHADLEDKVVSFEKLSDNAYAYTAEGDPNTGIIVGDDAVMVVDTQATPVMAQDVIRRVREVTDKPIKYILLSHYHAVRVFGASAYGAQEILASRDTYDLIAERGEQDKASEIGRFPRLFRNVESIPPGLVWPTMTFKGEMTVDLGNLEVKLLQVGRGHTKGDTIAWLPEQKILFAGDLVEYQSTPYCGDCYFREWPATLDALAGFEAEKMVLPRPGAQERHRSAPGPGRHARLPDRPVRRRQPRRGRWQGPQDDLPRGLRFHEAALQPVGDLRPLHAVQRLARLRRGNRPLRSAHLDRQARHRDVAAARRLIAPPHRWARPAAFAPAARPA